MLPKVSFNFEFQLIFTTTNTKTIQTHKEKTLRIETHGRFSIGTKKEIWVDITEVKVTSQYYGR